MKQKKTLFADILETVTKYFLILVVVVLIGVFLSGLRVVEEGNVAVVLRFGKLIGENREEQVHGPGLMFAFPYIIDEVIMVPTGSVMEQQVLTHYTDADTDTAKGGYVITGDQNVAIVAASVKYTVSDPVAYALYVKDVPAMIDAVVSNALLCGAARMKVDSLLTDGKDAYTKAVLERAEEKLQTMGVGVTLSSVELTTVTMPEEVRNVYEAVNSAAVQYATILERARGYRTSTLLAAESQSATVVAEARAWGNKEVAAANAALAEFWGVLAEYERSPDVVTTRVFAEKCSLIMQKLNRIYLVSDDDGKIFIDP